MTRTIEIDDVGAINHVTIPLPEEGGLVVLKGTHGVGKSTALEATQSLASGNGTLEKRDGAIEGRVSGFGATLTVKKVTRRSGQPEIAVDRLGGRLGLADIVDPHIKDPVAADAYRIKALLQIAGAKPHIDDWHALVGGAQEFARIVGPADSTDAVELSAKVKRAIAKAAREVETAAEKAAGEARAYRNEASGFEGVELVDPAELQRRLEEAIRHESSLSMQAKSAQTQIDGATTARLALKQAQDSYEGPTVEQAADAVHKASEATAAAQDEVDCLRAALDEATRKAKALAVEEDRLGAELKAAKQHADSMARWQASIAAAADVTAPSDADLEAATNAVATARQAIEQQALARKAKQAQQAAETAEAQAKSHRERAEQLRNAADKTDDVLTGMVARINCPLRVKHDRLVLDTDRGEELFADLSDGERYKVAFDLVIPLLPPDGLLTLSQAAFGELSPATRRELDAALKARKATCLTAQVDDSPELYAEAFGGSPHDDLRAIR